MERDIRGDVMLTVGDVARLLAVHVGTVRRWTNQGILQAHRIGPRNDRRFRLEDVASLLIEPSEKLEGANKK